MFWSTVPGTEAGVGRAFARRFNLPDTTVFTPTLTGLGERSHLQPVDRAIPMVSVADVGRLVADTLWKSWSRQRVIELEGPQRYAPNDVATALTAVLGRSVKAEALPRGHWDQAFRTLGFTVGSSKAVAEMLDGFNSWIEFEKPKGTVHGTTSLEAVLATLVEQSRS